MKIKNIIIYNDFNIPFGGAGKVAYDSVRLLAEQGYNVVFFYGTSGKPSEELIKLGVKYISLGQKEMLFEHNKLKAALHSLWNIKAYIESKKLQKKYSADDTVIMIHGFSKILSSSIFSAFKGTDYKILYFLHDYFAACPNGGFHNYQTHKNCNLKPLSKECWKCNCDLRNYCHKLYRCIRQISYRKSISGNSRNILGFNVSDFSGNLMQQYIKKWFTRYETLYNPVDLNTDDFIDITKNEYYIFIGRLSEEKGIREFCKSMTELSLKGIVLGEGYLYEEMVNEYPNIEFVGWVDPKDKLKYLNMVKCLIFPSKVHETFGLTIAETLSYGIPCIMPEECGSSFLIKNGINGFLYEMGNYEMLIESIKKFENCNLNSIMESTRSNTVEIDFSYKKYISNLENIFKSL